MALTSLFPCHSVVRSVCIHQMVKQGTLLALIGILPLMLAGIFMPSKMLHGWGLLFLAFFLALSTMGLLPLKRLMRKQLHPDLLFVEDSLLIYAPKGRVPKTFPLSNILLTRYIARSQTHYGVEIHFKSNEQIFFPYFTQETSNILNDLIQAGRDKEEDE